MKLKTVFITLSLLLATLFVIPNAKADSSITWTTTADFDSGNKSDPGVIWFADNGVDQPMYNFISQPQAIYSSEFDKTYVAYFGANTSTSVASIFVTYYNHDTGTWRNPVWIFNVVDKDGHRNPAIWVLSSGRIIVLGGSHDNAIQAWRTTTTNGEIDSWTQLSNPETVATYPNLIEYPSGTLWFFYRTAAAAGGDFGYRKSTNDGTSWTTETSFIDMGADGLYWGKWLLTGNRLYIPWVKYNFTGSGQRQDVFVCYMNLDSGVGFSLDNDNLGMTISSAEANLNDGDGGCRVTHQTDGTTSNNIPVLDLVGTNVYLFYIQGITPYDPDDWTLQFRKRTGSWGPPTEIMDIGASSSYMDIEMTNDNTGEAFVTTSGFTTGCTLDCEFTGDLERWVWNGATWGFSEDILPEYISGRPVNHPYYPLNWKEPIRLVFDEFTTAGEDLSDQERPEGTSHLYAWGDSGFIGFLGRSSGTFGVETSSDSLNVASGSFELASLRSDIFNRTFYSASTFGESIWKWTSIFSQGNNGAQCTREIENGIYNVSHVVNAAAECWVFSRETIGGGFDFRLKFDRTQGFKTYGLCWLNIALECHRTVQGAYPSTVSGVIYDNLNGAIQAARVVNGVITFLGSSTANANDPLWFRINRTVSSDIFQFRWSTDGTIWNIDETLTIASMPIDGFPSFYSYSNGAAYGQPMVEVDNFQVTAGTYIGDSFRRTASWISQLQTGSTEVARYIVISYSGATSGRYIDAVRLVDSDGNTLYVDGTNIIFGSSVNVTIPQWLLYSLLNVDWSIKIDLVGDGSGSININGITVFTVEAPQIAFTSIAGDFLYILGFIAVLVLFFVMMFWLRKRREGVLR